MHEHWATVVDLQPFEPLPDPKTEREGPREGATGNGGLVVRSVPAKCSIDAPSLGWTNIEKTTEEWSAEVAEGSYRMQFRAQGKTLEHVARIDRHRDLYLLVDFDEGRVIEVHALGRESRSRDRPNEREACIEGEAISASWPSPGWITVDARPHAEVYLESMKLGETPLANVKLPAGCVRLRFVDPDTRAEHVRAVWVEPNEITAYRCVLADRACEPPTTLTSARGRP